MKQFLVLLNDFDDIREKFSYAYEYIDKVNPASVLVHVFFGEWDVAAAKTLTAAINRTIPDAKIVGSVSCGEIFEGNLAALRCMAVVSVFDCTKIEVLTYKFHGGEEETTARRLAKDINARAETKAAEFLMAMAGYDKQKFIESIDINNKNLVVFGAGVTGVTNPTQTAFVSTNSGIVTCGMIAVFYEGTDFHVHVEHIFGWEPLGKEMTVTKSKPLLLMEVDGKPAYDVYSHYLQIPRTGNFFANILGFPFLTQDRQTDVVRLSHACDDNGYLSLSADIAKGSKLRITYGNLGEIFREVTAGRDKIRRFAPQAIMIYDCASRKMLWQTGTDQELQPFQKIAPTAGFFCEGEFKNNDKGLIVNHQCTLLAIGMREGEGKVIPATEAKIEELKFYTDSSIVKRMAAFVQTTTAELEKANSKLAALNSELSTINAKLSYMAVTDELTGLFNRREIDKRIQDAVAAAKDNNDVLSIIMIDIDHFKRVNDTYGHAVGDIVLKDAAAVIRDSLNENTMATAGRWGGEEFLVLLPSFSLSEATEFAETIRQKFAAHSFDTAGAQTLSLGVTATFGYEDEKNIFIRADDALYKAKTGGRNQVVSISAEDMKTVV